MLIQLRVLTSQIYKNAACSRYLSSSSNSRIISESLDRIKKIINSPRFLFIKLQNFVNMFTRNTFDEEAIIKCYRRAKLDINKWCLVYNDPFGTIIIKTMFVLFWLCPFLYQSTIMAIDYWQHGKFTKERYVMLCRELDKIGLFRYLILLLPFISVMLALRLHSMQISQIYLNRQNPSELLVCGRYYMLNKLMKIERKDIVIYNHNENHLTRLYHVFRADAKFGRMGKCLLRPNSFRNNAFFCYVLKLSNRVPNTTSSIDLHLLSVTI